MTVKGGIQPRKDGSLSHLISGKWKLGKTTVLRVPIVLKNKLIDLAKHFDELEDYETVYQNMIEYIKHKNELINEVDKLKSENLKLKQELEVKNKDNKTTENTINNLILDNQLSVDKFVEYLENNNLKIEEISKAKKGTKKHLLWEIYQLFEK